MNQLHHLDHFYPKSDDSWFGGSFTSLHFSDFLKVIEENRRDGRILVDWHEEKNGVYEFGVASIILVSGYFTNAYFRTSYQQGNDVENIKAIELLLRRIWRIGTSSNIQGKYLFEPDEQISSRYHSDFSLNTLDINEIVTELQEFSINSDSSSPQLRLLV